MNTSAPSIPFDFRRKSSGEYEVTAAGCVAIVGVDYCPSDWSVGVGGGYESGVGPAKLVDRAAWDAACPGVEPTDDAIAAVFSALDSRIREDVEDAAERYAADDFDPPEPDDDWGRDY